MSPFNNESPQSYENSLLPLVRKEDDKETERDRERPDTKNGPTVEKELFEARVVLISAPVDPKLAHAVNSKMLALERHDSKAPIYLFINSPGGEVHSGFSIFDCARFIRPPVVTIVTGLAASMGSIISLCAPRQHRFAFPNSKFLVHQPSISGMGGSVSDIEIHAKDLIDTKNRIIELYCRECDRTPDEVRKALDRDNWMNPELAMKWGHISKIVTTRDDLQI